MMQQNITEDVISTGLGGHEIAWSVYNFNINSPKRCQSSVVTR